MESLNPENFWRLYKREIHENGSWDAYQYGRAWTEIAVSAGSAVCEKSFDLETQREYFRLDLIGWDGPRGSHYDWDLQVAFEAENTQKWEDELCKLAHIVSILRVLVAYQGHAGWRAEEALDGYLVRHKRRVVRDPSCKWLFIFGPDPADRNDCWAAYTLDERGERVRINDEPPLLGIHMKNK